MPLLFEVQKELAQLLHSFGIEPMECRKEVELIIEHATGWSATQQLLNQQTEVEATSVQKIMAIVERRKKREPIQYCLGHSWFMGHNLKVESNVFIPRPDTEALVLTILRRYPGLMQAVEIGIGSGAIAIALLLRLPQLKVTGIDLSATAISLSRCNAISNQVVERLTLVHADWEQVEISQVDAIVSNPPYIPSSQAPCLQPEVGLWEPKVALFGQGKDGLGFYRKLATVAPKCLRKGGLVAVEIGDDQSDAVVSVFKKHGFKDIELDYDLNKLPRVVSAFTK